MVANALGIDLGGKAVGLAVVERPGNRVLWCGTVHLSDKIRDLYDQRRTLRRARRGRGRYRKPKVPQRGGGSAGQTQWSGFRYRRAKGLNQSLRTKCKYVDPDTGEVCGRNTAKRSNVRHLFLEDILGFAPFSDVPADYKQAIRDVLASREGIATRKQRLAAVLSRIDVDRYLKKQITEICFDERGGRAEFCRDHIPARHTQTAIPTQAVWLPPSIRIKQDFLLKHVRQLAASVRIDRIVIERANFDLQKIAKGVIDDPAEYQQGARYGFRNTRMALMQEYGARCCYCGKSVVGEKWHVDHIDPRRTGETNRWNNLAIACEKCNHKKGGRTPLDAGMAFAVVGETVAGRRIRRRLEPKPLAGSRINKYMTQTDQGIRILKRSLAEIVPGAPIEETYGYVTSAWRDLWGLEKGREKQEHHNDAIVIASLREVAAVPIVEVSPQAIRQTVGGKRLFDLNPVQRARDAKYYQRGPVVAEVGGIAPAQLPAVVDERKRKLLAREFARYGVTGRKPLPPPALDRLPFKSVRLRKRDCTDANVRRMATGHRFKLSNPGGTRVNQAVVVYLTSAGKRASYAVKNTRAFGPTAPPDDLDRELWRFRPGDAVADRDGGAIGRVVKLGSDGTLTLDSGKTRKAHTCSKGGGRMTTS